MPAAAAGTNPLRPKAKYFYNDTKFELPRCFLKKKKV
jgi:hypothetical protein